jgi:hypothetical protein
MKFKFKHRPASDPLGRFGGGWQVKAGFQASRHTLIISLFVFDLRIDFT